MGRGGGAGRGVALVVVPLQGGVGTPRGYGNLLAGRPAAAAVGGSLSMSLSTQYLANAYFKIKIQDYTEHY
eukprot:SAG31_NODE_825_length_11760_cov_5.637767_6_plen_71_part_00